MTPPPTYRPPNPPARRASTLLLVTAALATLMGVGLVLASANPPEMPDDPALRENLATLRQRHGIEPKHLFMGLGVAVLAYATVALTLGLTVRRGGPVACALGGVLCAMAALVAGLLAIFTIAAGNVTGVVMPLAFAVLHGLCATWLTAAATAGTTGPSLAPRRPMEAYYLPPVEPAAAV